VPPNGSAFPSVLKLTTPSPGALNPLRPMELPKFDRLSGLPRLSQAITGITAGCRVIPCFKPFPGFPPRPRRSLRALRHNRAPQPTRVHLLLTGSAGGLRLNSPGERPHRCTRKWPPREFLRRGARQHLIRREVLSEKIGRTSKVQPGQIAGATELLFAHKMLATNVPCVQATLST
jgi:hypothetical protein